MTVLAAGRAPPTCGRTDAEPELALRTDIVLVVVGDADQVQKLRTRAAT